MRLRKLFCSTLILAVGMAGLKAQVTLLSEDFNGCAIPPNWEVAAVGNQTPTWSVGISQNNDALGQSIDGTCFLFIDDESEGNNTPGYTLSFMSPVFNAAQYATVLLTMDVHYRDWDGATDYLEILVSDGTTEKLVSRFDKDRKNDQTISEHFSLRADLALLTQSANSRLIIRYSDGGGAWAWWAGVDNIKIVGSGTGTNVIRETFNGCAKPAGWETQMATGTKDWKFGLIQQGSNALQGGSSMDGTCFAYFDDDANGGTAASSRVRLMSPWFDGTAFAKFELNYDVILRFYKEKIRIIVLHQSGTEFLVQESNDDIGGPFFPQYEHETLDISFYRAQQMRVVFEFDDGGDWGWWAGIDNVKVTGTGVALDLCANALQLTTGAPCVAGDNLSAFFEGPLSTCVDKSVAGLWYRWQATFTGTAKLTTHAEFNDVVSVFTGTCASPQLVTCNTRDEHGFTGETTYFSAQSGTQYLIRVSGQEGMFGAPRGTLCVEIGPGSIPAPPPNDNCPNAVALTPNGNCTIGSNLNATMSATLPSLNLLARADLWYTFTAPALVAGEKLEIQSNATFSDIITLYAGGCNALQEVAGNHHGGLLELPTLTAGQNYWVQIAGNFATVEGALCPQLIKKQVNAPANDDCAAAINIPVGGQCVAGTNLNSSPSAFTPSCLVSVDRDVWFKFTAPVSGSVHINTGADFEHALAIWQGGCNNMTQVFCAENPLRCDGFVTATGLVSGQVYYVQIASWNGASGNTTGDVCLKIVNGTNQPDFQPLVLEVAENCVGPNSAELLVTSSGGLQPYTLSGYTAGQTLPSGETYLVVLTDAMGCERTVFGTIDDCGIVNCTLTSTATATQPKCFGSADGSLTATPANGTPPYSYLWSNAAVTPTISNLAAGIYSLTVSDAGGCTFALSQTLTAPQAIGITPITVHPLCFGVATGSISASIAGGTPPYQYLWSNNAVTPSIMNLAVGPYSLTVTDANLCTNTASQTITSPPAILITPLPTLPDCPGDANGVLFANVTGGVSPYEYVWSTGATISEITNLATGDYSLTVTDANDCQSTITYTLPDPPPIVITADVVIQPTLGQDDGTITVNITGGTGVYSYSWTRNGVLFVAGVKDLTHIPEGSYQLQVTDAKGCTAVFTYNLTTVGTSNPNDAFSAVVFPNPAQDRAILAVSFTQPQTLRLSLNDAAGRALHAWTVDNVTERHIPLDLKNLPSGVYQLRILAGNEVVARKVVVER